MTYQTKCNGACTERIDKQAETIRKLRDENLKKTEALLEASNQIVRLKSEKRDLTQALNNTSKHINMRSDQNWDSRPRVEQDEHRIEFTDEGIHAIDREDPNKQMKIFHENGVRVIARTDDNWESSEILYTGE